MKVQIIPVTPFQQNCSLIWCERTRKAAFIDPGGDLDKLLPALEQHNLSLEKILLTHGHLDHVGGTAELSARFSVPIEGPHKEDAFWIEQIGMQSQHFGFPPVASFTPNRWLQDGDVVTVGEEIRLQVLHCPGHTPGHVVFFNAQPALAFVGDVLFKGSIGRTDFPRSDHEALINAIRHKLWPLGDEVSFVPGHGPMSTFGDERKTNAFVADTRFG